MRTRSIITAVVTILIIAGALYYLYGYGHRDISSDFNAVKEYSEDAATTSAVKSALALNKQLSSFDIHVDSTNNPGKSGNDVTLTGHVPSEDDKRVAEEIARSTKGVANVVNNLQVDPKTQAANAEIGEGQP
jgi:osmotically-inducible protein OsmY